jgi:hypothetical protein
MSTSEQSALQTRTAGMVRELSHDITGMVSDGRHDPRFEDKK